jgi:ABC-2 type transport system ATP-binding protein
VLVHARGLTRTFDTRLAVEDLSLDVEGGEIVSLLGPNGAGKTTTFRMLAGLILPSRGDVAIAGLRLTPESASAIRTRVGLLTEAPGLWERLSVRLNLLTYARLHEVANPMDAVERAVARVDLTDRLDDRAGALSKGLKQRAALARALLHDPQVVLLDEPTSGLDPAAARQVRDLIASLREQGRAVVVSTHNLAEAEELSDRIAVLRTRLIACDAPARLRGDASGMRVTIEVEGDAAVWSDLAQAAGASVRQAEGSALVLAVRGARQVPDLVSALAAGGARIVRVEPDRRSLEDAYLALVGGQEGAA